ncbi:MAG: hypothetical protein AAF479_03215 [Pseudomonadota bacterium]
MTDDKKSKPKRDPDTLQVERSHSARTDEDAISAGSLMPSLQAALTLKEYNRVFGNVSLGGLADALRDQISATKENDLARGEAMLTAQAHTLDAIFNNFARRAIQADYMNQLEAYLKLALRAQSQARTTWEAISAIKNPPIAGYVGQANIANGPQQVNNGSGQSRARQNKKSKNELLEQNDGERLDAGAALASGRDDPQMEAVEKLDGTTDT